MTRCAVCQKEASARCAKCRQIYYCCVEHQREHWPSHKSDCVAPFVELVRDEMFPSYFYGALFVYNQVGEFSLGHKVADTIFGDFVKQRADAIAAMGDACAKKEKSGALTVDTMTRRRADALKSLEQHLHSQEMTLSPEQKEHLKEPIDKHRKHLTASGKQAKPLAYVCGYAHASLEIMQRLLRSDLSNKEYATERGAAAIASCTVALQAALERIEALVKSEEVK